MITQISKLQTFRESIYSLFPYRKDALMNLLDALTSYGHHCDSVVQLSQADCFERHYSSITDAIADGLPHMDWPSMMKQVYSSVVTKDHLSKMSTFLLDCTSQPRPHAKKLSDRMITHAPNPAPGNKPICLGHQYSLLGLLPSDDEASKKHWIIPLSVERVKSHQKGNEQGMQQLIDTIKDLGLSDQFTLSIGDTLYGTENCRIKASQKDNLIHLFRLNSKRKVYLSERGEEKQQNRRERKNTRGRKKEYGSKIILSDPKTHPPCHQQEEKTWTTRKGKVCTVLIKGWQNMILRGSRQFRAAHHPMTVIQVTVTDNKGELVFKRPLWLAVFGKYRDKISIAEAYEKYIKRYDIEHFFRFGKQKLLLEFYQTPETIHEENWWKFCLLAYIQLYLARSLVPAIPQPWERYLPEYKNGNTIKSILTTPSQTQRGFNPLLKEMGTPAQTCLARGKSRGRMPGEMVTKRTDQPIIFKSKKENPQRPEDILSGFEKALKCSNPQKIDDLLKVVQNTLTQLKISPSQFAKRLNDTS